MLVGVHGFDMVNRPVAFFQLLTSVVILVCHDCNRRKINNRNKCILMLFFLLEMRIQSDKNNVTHPNSQTERFGSSLGVANVY